VRQRGSYRSLEAFDFFIFSKELFKNIPKFAIGRAYYDDWLIWKAHALKIPIIDVSSFATVIHQKHDYSHLGGGLAEACMGEEAMENVRIGGSMSRVLYNIHDATHQLTINGLRRNRFTKYQLHNLRLIRGRLWYRILDMTRPVRYALGLRSGILKKVIRNFSDQK
jgi:hypothetical protein